MGRKRAFAWRWRVLGALLLAVLAGAGWLWWQAQHWVPLRASFPQQGVVLGAGDGPVDMAGVKAIGAGFVYLEASSGAELRDSAFSRNLQAAQAAAMPFGAVHGYDPCVPAEQQAANFVTMVPRNTQQLPPAIVLDKPADGCADHLREAALEAELTTFINQVEAHVGQPVILRLSEEFEARHAIAARVERNLWLERDYFQPDYAGRPWTLWTANGALATAASDTPLRWVVVQP